MTVSIPVDAAAVSRPDAASESFAVVSGRASVPCVASCPTESAVEQRTSMMKSGKRIALHHQACRTDHAGRITELRLKNANSATVGYEHTRDYASMNGVE